MASTTLSRAKGSGPAAGIGGGAQKVWVYAEVTPTALATNDYFEMFKVPANAVITDVVLYADDLDSNGTPTAALSVGDSSSATRFISSSTVGQAGGFTTTLASGTGAMFYRYTATTTIRVTASTGAATFQSGTIKLAMGYFIYDQMVTS